VLYLDNWELLGTEADLDCPLLVSSKMLFCLHDMVVDYHGVNLLAQGGMLECKELGLYDTELEFQSKGLEFYGRE